MFEFLFDLPLLITGPAIIGSLCLFAEVGLAVVRRRVLPRLRIREADSEFTGAMMQSVLVFYGLAVALMAVSVSQTYTDVSETISGEATALAALYRDVSSYPEPVRPQLQNELRDYVRYVIEEAWPLRRRGKVPGGGVAHVDRFQAILVGFEPSTEGQRLLHGETLRAYNQMIQARPSATGCGEHRFTGSDVGRHRCRRVDRPERLLLFQSGRWAIAWNPGAPPGGVHRAGHFHDLRAGPPLSRRPGTRARSVSIDLRPNDEAWSVKGRSYVTPAS